MLAVMTTDGRRECLERSVASLLDNVHGVDRLVLVDDSGDEQHRRWLRSTFGDVAVVDGDGPRRGYARAVQRAWQHVARCGDPWAFVAEDDFVYQRPVDLVQLVGLLDARPYLAQVALRRQPWFATEVDAGGVLDVFEPSRFVQCHDFDRGWWWIEHRLFWTQNPHVLPVGRARGWPSGAHSEHRHAHRVFVDGQTRVAYWGRLDEPPWVHHIGEKRRGTGY